MIYIVFLKLLQEKRKLEGREKKVIKSTSEVKGGKLEDPFWEINGHLVTVLDTAGSSSPA